MNRLAWWVGGASILLLVAMPTWVSISRPKTDIGSLELLRRAKVPALRESEVARLRPPRVVVRSGLLTDQAIHADGGILERLRIGAIGVDARIVPVGRA